MAKIRLIEDSTWLAFHKQMMIQNLTQNQLLNNLLSGPTVAIVRHSDLEGLELKDHHDDSEYLAKINKLEEINKQLNDEHQAHIEKWDEQFKRDEMVLAKDIKLIEKQKTAIQKKNEKLKDYRELTSSLKKENRKLGKQVKALTIVNEDEEDGDSESTIFGPNT